MKQTVIYLSHWRFPSEKTMTPLIMKTCEGFLAEGFDAELWVPTRHNPTWKGKDPFNVHDIKMRFPIRHIGTIDGIRYAHRLGFLLMVASFNLSSFLRLLIGNRKHRILYAHDMRDLVLPSFFPG